MGCLQSKHVQGDGGTFVGSHSSNALEHSSSSHSQKNSPIKNGSSAARSARELPSHGGSRETSCMLSEVLSDQNIEWKLDMEDIESRNTFKTLECIKDTTCQESNVAKGRICLFDVNLVHFMTTTGAFAPALPLAGSIIGKQFNDFQFNNDRSIAICLDMRQHPVFKDHPAVTQRPHVVSYAGKLLISENNHPLGLIFVWESKTGHSFTKKQEESFAELAQEATEVLQRSMLRGIGADVTNSKKKSSSNDSGKERELATIWIDMDDPEWRVFGINEQWEKLTGIGLDIFSEFPGLLTVMIPSDGSDSTAMWHSVQEAANNQALRAGASLPVILSPKASSGGSLQFAMALKRATRPPPLRQFSDGTASGSPPIKEPNMWVVEVHARVQADVHIGDFPSQDLTTALGFTSESGSDGSLNMNNTAGSANVSGTVSVGTPIGVHARIPPRLAALKVGKLIGAGSYANVYAGYLGSRPVAVKVMHHNHGPNSQKDEWTSHYEALMTVDIAHDNVVTTLDWCRIEDVRGFEVWIVQELCEKGSLSGALQANVFGINKVIKEGTDSDDSIEAKENAARYKIILQTAREIARGMRYLHSEDEMHGDLSSNNVLLAHGDNSRGFVAKVTDFGLSRASKDEVLTKTVGTVSHMPPELLLEGLMTKAGDVYSFGVLLWELWCGKRAWDKMSQAQVIFAVTCRNEYLQMPDDAPPEYAALAMQCMSKDRYKRPSFDEIVPRIDDMLAKMPGLLSSASGTSIKKSIANFHKE